MKFAELFRKITTEELAARELDQARRSLLEAQTAREYAQAMVQYHEQRIDRLRTTLDMDARLMK